MSFSPVGAASNPVIYNALSFDLDGMLKKARTYSDNCDFNADGVFNYIKDVLNDPNFQSNPKSYLALWKERRGDSEELRVPEDNAHNFFYANFN